MRFRLIRPSRAARPLICSLVVLLSSLSITDVGLAGETRTLDEFIDIALQNHPTLKSAEADVAGARARVRQAAAGYLPDLSANYSAGRRKSTVGGSSGTAFGAQSRTIGFYSTGVGFNQVLFDFGRNLEVIRSVQSSRRAAEADQLRDREVVILEVKQTYFDFLAARRLLKVAEESVEQSRTQLSEAESREAVGLAPRLDITRAQVQLANAELDRLNANRNLSIAHESLRNAIGLRQPLDFEPLDVGEPPAVNVSEEKAVEFAHARRPELLSLVEQRSTMEHQASALKRDYFPTVNAAGGYDWSGSEYPLQDTWNVGAILTLSIFNGGRTTAEISEARAAADRLSHEEENLRQDIELAVRRTVFDLRLAAESIRVTETASRQARENLEQAEGRYSGGVGNIIELTDARTLYTSAEAQHVRSFYQYRIAIASLEREMALPMVQWEEVK